MSIIHLNEEKSREIIPGWHAKIVHSDNMTLISWEVEEGALLPEHLHEHEQITNIIEGEFRLIMDNDVKILKAGDTAVIPSHTKHEGLALTPCKIIDAFYPVREDYLRGEKKTDE